MQQPTSSDDSFRVLPKYQDEFEEIERIGRGAYGSVYKCQNKFDGKQYAIKKIKLKKAKAEEWKRAQSEVKALANLQHKAIVRYHTSWLEEMCPTDSDELWSIGSTNTQSTPDVFEDDESESTQSESQDENISSDNGRTGILYIQMELCGDTLKDWITRRNISFDSDDEFFIYLKGGECMMIFKRILQAVDCIHDHGLIHRDLKPQNVFMVENARVKVGDFGLATNDIFSDDPVTPVKAGVVLNDQKRDRLTSGVGTPTYAAPEQLDDSGYTNKADVYSLGVILFELYQKFDTEMERCKALMNLKEGNIQDSLRECWPVQANYIKNMTSPDPQARPSVKDILAENELFLSKDKIIADLEEKDRILEERIKKSKASVKKMQTKLSKQKRKVDEMHMKSGEYAIQIKDLKRLIKMKDELMQVAISDLESQLINEMEAKDARRVAEIKKLKLRLNKKDVALKKKNKLLKKNEALITDMANAINEMSLQQYTLAVNIY